MVKKKRKLPPGDEAGPFPWGYQTIRESLDEKRQQLAGKVDSLVYCKGELFYNLTGGNHNSGATDSVYPVSRDLVGKEAEFFGCPWIEG